MSPKSRTSCIASFRTKSTATEFRSALIRHRQLSRVSPARRLRILVNCHPVLITGNENKNNFYYHHLHQQPKQSYYHHPIFSNHHHIAVSTKLKKNPFKLSKSMNFISIDIERHRLYFSGCNHFVFITLIRKKVIFVIVGSFCIN